MKPKNNILPRKCAHCGDEFVSNNSRKKYCKDSCKTRAYEKRNNISTPKFILNGQSGITPIEIAVKSNKPETNNLDKNFGKLIAKKTILNNEKRLLIEKLNVATGYNKTLAYTVGAGAGTFGLMKLVTENTITQLVVATAIGTCVGVASNNIQQQKSNKSEIEFIDNKIQKINKEILEVEKDIKQNRAEYLKKSLKDESNEIPTIEFLSLDSFNTKLANKPSFTTSADLVNTSFELQRLNGRMGEFLGSIGKSTFITAYGTPGSGKSTLFLQLADNFTKFGKVIFVTPEEGLSPTLKQKLINNNINNPNIHIEDFVKLSDIRESLKKGIYRSCFIDSINMIIDATPGKLEILRKDFPNTTFAIILQSTKDGKFKGSNEYAHNSDINIVVNEGKARTIKNRYKPPAEYVVFITK